jgi:hypothetical protein
MVEREKVKAQIIVTVKPTRKKKGWQWELEKWYNKKYYDEIELHGKTRQIWIDNTPIRKWHENHLMHPEDYWGDEPENFVIEGVEVEINVKGKTIYKKYIEVYDLDLGLDFDECGGGHL